MTRIVVGLITLCAIIEGLAPGAVPSDLMPLALVVLGLVYGWTAIDAEDPVAYLAVTIAAGMATSMPEVSGSGGDSTGVLHLIPAVGSYLDSIVDQVVTALYAGVISVLVARSMNRLKG